jgi:CRISPR-associated protein Cas1
MEIKMRDLHELPKLRDGLSYLYLERCRIDKKQQAVEFIDEEGRTMIPAAALAVLMLGPGTSITHAAVKTLADGGCLVVWVGEDGTRCYAQGGGETRRAYHLLRQAELSSDPEKRLCVVKRMYQRRFGDKLAPGLTLQQVRGLEGQRVRQAYAQASARYGVVWRGRRYDRNDWTGSDPINRTLSAVNALLNGLCHAAIVSGGYSPALGFIHTGKQLSFVYDIADLYKVEMTIPLAFRVVAEATDHLRSRVRLACRETFRERKLLKRILPDIENLLDISAEVLQAGEEVDSDPARPEPLWTPAGGSEVQTSLSTEDWESEAIQRRRQRAEVGLRGEWVVCPRGPDEWNVTTRRDKPGYTIRQTSAGWLCDCPDFARNGLGMCKHTAAVELGQAGREATGEA